jgi:hypothetical protein
MKLEANSKRRAAIIVAFFVGLAVLGWGGWTLYGRLTGRPLTVPQMKRVIRKYVAKQARKKITLPALDLSTAALLDGSGTTTVTNKNGRARTVTKTARGSQELPDTTLSEYFRTNEMSAGTYELIYRALGEQLLAADALLESTNAARQLVGVVMAGEASVYARTNAQNLWLGARICEAYLWPHISLAAASNRTSISLEALLTLCDGAFKDAGETNHLVQTYELMIAKSRVQQADVARFRLALIYMDQGENAKALKLLKALTTLKTAKIARDIARLETLVPPEQK